MPTVTELSQPQRFIQSALANVDSAHGLFGLTAYVWDVGMMLK